MTKAARWILGMTLLLGVGTSPITLVAGDGAAGLASRYVGDVGISQDPRVVFAEDFEDDDLKRRGWYDMAGWGERLLISDEDRVEYMGKMNTPGKADGELRAWIDGELQYEITGVMLRDEKTSDVTWRRWWLGPYFHGGTTKEQSSFLDSLVMATVYIGPVR
ncbi:MAG: hypothetical protein JXR37_26575 [Kiritimatiellae bacterium]|nr:hypothetical protein [Kiritimatiellia bacterium]